MRATLLILNGRPTRNEDSDGYRGAMACLIANKDANLSTKRVGQLADRLSRGNGYRSDWS